MVSSGAATVRVRITYAILLILLAILPWLGVYPVFVMKLLCFALFACALNLLLGYTGLLSFGHAALFGMAAYVCGWVTTALHWPSLGGLLAGMDLGVDRPRDGRGVDPAPGHRENPNGSLGAGTINAWRKPFSRRDLAQRGARRRQG